MIEKSQRPLIDRPRYNPQPQNNINAKNSNKTVNKKNLNKRQEKRKVTNKQMQQPVSGSMNKIDEDIKVKPLVKLKSKPTRKRKTKKPPMPPREPRVPKEEKKDSGMFKQMKDKFIGKPKDEGGN